MQLHMQHINRCLWRYRPHQAAMNINKVEDLTCEVWPLADFTSALDDMSMSSKGDRQADNTYILAIRHVHTYTQLWSRAILFRARTVVLR